MFVLVLLSSTDLSPCNYSFGKTLEEDLRKIDSYHLPEANPFLNKLLPGNFKAKDAKYYVGDVAIDQSLPSIPAFVTACSANHFLESMELVLNIKNVVRPANKDIKFFYYDMGLTERQRNKVRG